MTLYLFNIIILSPCYLKQNKKSEHFSQHWWNILAVGLAFVQTIMLCISLFLSLSLSYCRFEQPKCDGNARAHPNKPKDHYRSRHLQGEHNCVLLSRCENIVQGLLWERNTSQLKTSKRTIYRNKAAKNNTFLPNSFTNIIRGSKMNK